MRAIKKPLAAVLLTAAIVLSLAVPAHARYFGNVWGELNGRGYVVNYQTFRDHVSTTRPRMHLDRVTAFNFRLWMRDRDGVRVSDRALFHTPGETTYWSSSSGSTIIPSGRYKLSGQMLGELQGGFDPSSIRWQGDITW
ncbi:MAG: hypothetical protein P0Y48_01060 [Candidatus Microbacterium phytovorans]|uniref:Uncharacterized protein n=1 Tax=Candidatus Microbacterium phytovorans TaxID=3121374 RepID=A0AAJ6B465_9MICO|nr:hypothetical protein [Microbacterium sp.]WEK13834.1 MAG: hypothetical protein P0Y48_01060 [Microbacterium sp.]